eukprot:TRINITY_DN944_c0_g2_i1.p1 TRINITY_DN944_c0_g2~~TRINITY_DN944_c0_g2_i1.p1  ORF type:complete len:505 (-),score=104.43 TRINITY_DN944_c0_g2_i1:312-1826(-)
MMSRFAFLAFIFASLWTFALSSDPCAGGCSGHGTCGMLGSCICEGHWAGRNCGYSLDMDESLLESRHVDLVPRTSVLLQEGFRPKSALIFSEAREAARDAWAAADRLYAAAERENRRDAQVRIQRALEKARLRRNEIPGHEFAGLQELQSQAERGTAQKSTVKACPSHCSGNGICLSGSCICNAGFYGLGCTNKRCPSDCSGHGACFQGSCHCEKKWEGESCASLIQAPVPPALASLVSIGLAAESKELQHQSSKSLEEASKSCPLDCAGHGVCNSGSCRCSDGWQGDACQDVTEVQSPIAKMLELQAESQPAEEEAQKTSATPSSATEDQNSPLQLQLQQQQLQLSELGANKAETNGMLCPNSCSNHGKCVSGMCECEDSYQGADCSITVGSSFFEGSKASDNADVPADLGKPLPLTASWLKTSTKAAEANPASLLATDASVRTKSSSQSQDQRVSVDENKLLSLMTKALRGANSQGDNLNLRDNLANLIASSMPIQTPPADS